MISAASIRNGVFALASRQAIGMLISLLFLLFVTKSIGVQNYGVYVSLVAIQGYIVSIASLGLNIFIIRKVSEPEIEDYHTAFTIMSLLVISLSSISSIILLRTNLFPALKSSPTAIIVIHLGAFFQIVNLIGMSSLERRFLFTKVASSDLIGQMVGVGISVILVIIEKSASSPILGYAAGQFISSLFTLFVSGYRPRIMIKGDLWREMVLYGVSYSASMWIWQARALVNPLIVGVILGPSAVGLIAIVQRLLDMFSFFKIAIYRLSIAVLGKIQNDNIRILIVLKIASNLQLIIISFIVLTYISIGNKLMVNFFGDEWRGLIYLFPFIAFSSIMNSSFSLYSSVLYAIKENALVAAFHSVNVILLALTAIIMIPHLGAIGFGIAEIVSAISYIFLYNVVSLKIGTSNDTRFFVVLITSLFGLLYYEIGYISLLPFLSLFMFKKYRNLVVEGLNLRSGDENEKN